MWFLVFRVVKIITREVELPHVPYKKLKNIIDLNADEYFPVNLAEYCLDFTITEIIETEEGKKIKVNIVAALKKTDSNVHRIST